MSEFFDGGKESDSVEVQSVSFEDMVNELAVAEDDEKSALVTSLAPSVRSFMHRALKSYRDSRAVMLLEGALVPSITVEPDIEAIEVMDGVIRFKNCAVVSGNPLDLRESRKLMMEVADYFKKSGYHVSGSMGLPFDLQIPVCEFEKVMHERAAIINEVDDTRRQIFA